MKGLNIKQEDEKTDKKEDRISDISINLGKLVQGKTLNQNLFETLNL